ncbi:MAG: hypothetical protein U1C73_09605 [Dietzia sp.]|nr:hypothetical protein [Dietzia sp.]
MSTDQPGPPRWGHRQTAAAVGIAAVIAGLGGAAIYAATSQSSPHVGPAAHQAFPAVGPGPACGPPAPADPGTPPPR